MYLHFRGYTFLIIGGKHAELNLISFRHLSNMPDTVTGESLKFIFSLTVEEDYQHVKIY